MEVSSLVSSNQLAHSNHVRASSNDRQEDSKSALLKKINPVLARRKQGRNRSIATQGRTSQSHTKETFLNADVAHLQQATNRGGGKSGRNAQSRTQRSANRNASAAALSSQPPQVPLGVRQFAGAPSNGESADFSQGIRKLMAKVQDMKADQSASNVYMEHPAAHLLQRGAVSSKAASRKGQMHFGRVNPGSGLGRPQVDSFITGGVATPLERQRRRLNRFELLPPQTQSRLQLSAANTSPHLLEAAQSVNLQGPTATQFEYLVNKQFLNNENKELDKQASRISKLNALCQKVTQDVAQLKRECREQNYKIDTAFQTDNKQARAGSQEELGPSPAQLESKQMMTPLEAVTQGINLMYATGPVKTRNPNAANFNSQTAQEQGEIVTSLPMIQPQVPLQQINYLQDYSNSGRAARSRVHSGNRRRVKSGSPQETTSQETSPTTVSKSYFTRRPPYGHPNNMDAKRKRVQSAVNKRSRQMAQILAQTNGSPVNINLFDRHDTDGQQLMSKSRRTQSAIFRPVSNAALSAGKFEQQSIQGLSNIRSSHPIFALRPESSFNTGAMSPEQMVQLLSQHFEQKLTEQPNALQSEADRKALIDQAIRQVFQTEKQSSEVDTTGKLDNLISKQKTSKLESIIENQNGNNQTASLPDNTRKSMDTSIPTDRLSDKVTRAKELDGPIPSLMKSPRESSTQIQVQVTDVEANSQMAAHLAKSGKKLDQIVSEPHSADLRKNSSCVPIEDDKRLEFTQNNVELQSQAQAVERNTNLAYLGIQRTQTHVTKGSLNNNPMIPSPHQATSLNYNDTRSDVGHLSSFGQAAGQPSSDDSKKRPTKEVEVRELGNSTNAAASNASCKYNRDLPAEIVVAENPIFVGSKADEAFDDEDYAYNKERRAMMEHRRLTALSYDSTKRTSKIAGCNALQPILAATGRPETKSVVSRATRMALQSSANADQQLSELYRSSIDEFKKKLYDQKQEAMLARVNRIQEQNNHREKQRKARSTASSKPKKKVQVQVSVERDNSPRKKFRKLPTVEISATRRLKNKRLNSIDENCASNKSSEGTNAKALSNPGSAILRNKKGASKVSSNQPTSPAVEVADEHELTFDAREQKLASGEETRPISPLAEPSDQRLSSPRSKGQTVTPEDGTKPSVSHRLSDGSEEAKVKTVKRKKSRIGNLLGKTTSVQVMKRRLTSKMSFLELGTEGQDSINIRIARQGSKTNLTKKKQIAEFVKNYQEDQVKTILTKDEMAFIDIVDEFKKEDEAKAAEAASSKAQNTVNKFLPNFFHKDKSDDPYSQLCADSTFLSGASAALNKSASALPSMGGNTQPLKPPPAPHVNKLKHDPAVRQARVHHFGNVSAKQHFFDEEQEVWANRVDQGGKDTFAYSQDLVGNFSFLEEPVDLHKSVPEQEPCFLSHPAMEDIYELEHGFKMHETYIHSEKMRVEGRWNTALDNIQTRDPRLTKSTSDLHALLAAEAILSGEESDQQTEVPRAPKKAVKEKKGKKSKKSPSKGDKKANEKSTYEVEAEHKGLSIDSTWFQYRTNPARQKRFLRPAADDLERSLQWKNAHLAKVRDVGLSLSEVKQTAFKRDFLESEWIRKMYHSCQGLIANLAHAECAFYIDEAIRDTRFEERLQEYYGSSLIPHIENMGQIAKSSLVTSSDVQLLEEEFQRQDQQVPLPSSLLEHPESLEFIEFDEVTENLPLDVSVEMQRFGVTKQPIKLSLVKVVEKQVEPPVQLVWLIKMDELLRDAISSVFYSPFKPAPILQNFKMEFNVLNVPSFRKQLKQLRPDHLVRLRFEFLPLRSRPLPGMMEFFNDQVRERPEQQTHLAIRFMRPLMKRHKREQMLRDGNFFRPDWHITNAHELQMFKRSKGIPDIVEARRDNAMELYVSHDVGSVRRHFYTQKSCPRFKVCISTVIGQCLTQMGDQSIELVSDESDQGDEDYDPALLSDDSDKSHVGYLNQLKRSPNKKQIKKKRPHVLAQFKPSVAREHEPVRIRLERHSRSQDTQAVIVVKNQGPSFHSMVRTPIRLHEQFQHVWSYKVRVYPQPRVGPLSLAHKIIPDGQSAGDFNNQDFCFYDVLELTLTPEFLRARQSQLQEIVDNKISHFFLNDKRLKSVTFSSAKKESSRKSRRSSKHGNSRERSHEGQSLSPFRGQEESKNNPTESSPSLLEANLDLPVMRKGKTSKSQKSAVSKKGQGSKSPLRTPGLNLQAMSRGNSSDESHLRPDKSNNTRKATKAKKSKGKHPAQRSKGRDGGDTNRSVSSAATNRSRSNSQAGGGRSGEKAKTGKRIALMSPGNLSRFKSHY